jgi:flagellar protein FliO/FliZ
MDPALPAATTGYGVALVQALLSLVLLCGLAFVVLRGMARRGMGGAVAGGRVRVLERVALDARRAVFLVQVGARVLLLGAGDGALTVLAELREDELPPAAKERAGGFAEMVARLRGGGKTGT